MYKLLSFDVYGTLMDTSPVSAKAFGRILADSGAKRRLQCRPRDVRRLLGAA